MTERSTHQRLHHPLRILAIVLAALVTSLPVASAQIETGVRINADEAGKLAEDARGRIGAQADQLGQSLGDHLPDGTQSLVPGGASGSNGDASTATLRLHTQINAALVRELVAAALEVPEVTDLIGSGARIDVQIDDTHFEVKVAGGSVASVSQTAAVDDPDYIIRAARDSARSLANAADPGFTAITLLQGHYLTVEAAKFAHQAALKAFFSGFLDSQIQVTDTLEDVVPSGPETAAESAIREAGLRIVRVDGRLFAANQLGGLVAALHEGSRALGNPPAELGVRLSGIAGGATMDRDGLSELVGGHAGTQHVQSALQGTGGALDSVGLVDAPRAAALEASGAPSAFISGLGANAVAQAALEGDGTS